MNASLLIRQALDEVATLRRQHQIDPPQAAAVSAIKSFQKQRFEATYKDLLSQSRYEMAARFFLEELYGDNDFQARDTQLARVAGPLGRLLPEQALQTVVSLARLHAQTEALDDTMARYWISCDGSAAQRYVLAWRDTGQRPLREQQLATVLSVGAELDRLVHKPGLRTLLRVMRGPAHAAGLGDIQAFLETGFDTFAGMRGATEFLGLIGQRESAWITRLFDERPVACVTALERLLNMGC